MIDYISCVINQKYIFAGGMLGGREGLGTSHHDHFLLLPVFYKKLPQINFFGIHIFLILSAVFCGLVWRFCTKSTFICTNEATEQASSCKVMVLLVLLFLMQDFPGMLTNKCSFTSLLDALRQTGKFRPLRDHKRVHRCTYTQAHMEKDHFWVRLYNCTHFFHVHFCGNILGLKSGKFHHFLLPTILLRWSQLWREFMLVLLLPLKSWQAFWWHQLSVFIKHFLAGKSETPFVVSSLDSNLHYVYQLGLFWCHLYQKWSKVFCIDLEFVFQQIFFNYLLNKHILYWLYTWIGKKNGLAFKGQSGLQKHFELLRIKCKALNT